MPNVASKVKGEGRSSWAFTFRHPVVKDPDEKSGLRIRRGARTPDPAIADKLVAQLNAILSDPSLWSAAAKESNVSISSMRSKSLLPAKTVEL